MSDRKSAIRTELSQSAHQALRDDLAAPVDLSCYSPQQRDTALDRLIDDLSDQAEPLVLVGQGDGVTAHDGNAITALGFVAIFWIAVGVIGGIALKLGL